MSKVISINGLEVGKSYEQKDLYALSDKCLTSGRYMFVQANDTVIELKSYDRGLTYQVLAIYERVK